MRNFRVAGIRGLLNSDEVLSIRTAVQVAMEYQTKGLEEQAEQIYRSILSESPQHADALHLLGVIFYQKGDANSAVPYIERALQSNKTFEGFHNSLGTCVKCHFCARLKSLKYYLWSANISLQCAMIQGSNITVTYCARHVFLLFILRGSYFSFQLV